MRKDDKQRNEMWDKFSDWLWQMLIFFIKRSIPDFKIVEIFLMTRVLKSEVENWEKLKKMLRFFHYTLEEKYDLEQKA